MRKNSWLAAKAPIVFTPGSTNVHARDFFAAAVESCQRLGRRAILLTEFPAQLPRQLPDAIAHFPYIPLDLLLFRSAAFVHHGGIGSMSQAMLAGIPQVLMPLAHDQFDNAARVKRLNVGDALPAPRFTASRLAPMLERLVRSPAIDSACRAVSQRLSARTGLATAVDAVESLVRSPRRAASPLAN